MRYTSILDRGMPVEVMKDFDTVLLFGKLTADTSEKLTIEQIPEEASFPICRIGSTVLVRGYDTQTNPVLLLGKVASSTRTQCVVRGWKRVPFETKRKCVRYPMTPPASVCILDGTELGQPQPCQMLNISMGGACIVSEYTYQAEQTLCLQVELSREREHTERYPCRMVRATPRGGGWYEYGLLFMEMDVGGRDSLERYIQSSQEKIRNKIGSPHALSGP